MKGATRHLDILRISKSGTTKERDFVVRETPVTIFLNDVDLVTLLCSPKDLEYLAVGFLFAEGLIAGKKDIKRVVADSKDGVVWVETKGGKKPQGNIVAKRSITTGCGRGLSFVGSAKHGKWPKPDTDFKLRADQVTELMREFQGMSRLFRKTGGVHSAGLARAANLIAFNEDIGRHNAIDKVLGELILKGRKRGANVLITSGRVSSDVLIKASRARIPVIISKSAPTDLAVKLARDLGITLVGFARGSRMNVYANESRIKPVR